MKNYIGTLLLFTILSCSQEKSFEPADSPPGNPDYLKAQQYFLVADNDSALIYINQALAKMDTTGYREMANIYLLSSKISNNIPLYEKAMENALKALEISEHHQLMDKKAAALLCIGNVYFRMYNDKEAEEYTLQAKSIAEEYNLETEMMQTAGALGRLYLASSDKEIDRNDEGLQLLNRALNIAQKQSDTLSIILYLMHIGDYYVSLNRRVDADKIVKEHQQNAKKYFDEAMNLALLKNATSQINSIRIGLIRWNRTERNYVKALEYAQEILQNTASNPNNYSVLMQVYDHLVGIYSYLGDARQTVAAHQQFYLMMIHQSDYNLHQALQEMSVKYETAEKQLEIERQQTEIEQHKARQIIYIGGITVAGLLLSLLVYIVVMRNRRNRELAEMNAIKDKFFSIISHDLKNPAVAQRDGLQVLAEHADKLDANALSDYCRKLLKSANGLVDLLKNLLTWAQIQTGREIYLPLPFDLVAALQRDMDIIKSMAERKNITFEAQLPLTAIITGDENMLVTIIRNLLTNAVKFTSAGGNVSLQINENSGKYIVSVSDTGVGMTPEQMQNLFRIDHQRSMRGTAEETGTGLGLIVCRDMLHKHGSALNVESEKEKGSRFWFEVCHS